MDWEHMSDEQLVEAYHEGNDHAAEILVERYKNLVRVKARTYFLAGADNEDLIQEGMIGLFKAIQGFEPERKIAFSTFAGTCILRQIQTAVTTANRQKNMFLNSYVSLDGPATDNPDEKMRLGEVIPSAGNRNPEDIFFERERINYLFESVFERLSKMERQVLDLYMEGRSYAEIGQILGKQPKSIDNTIQRIRGKIGSLRA